MTTRKEMTKAIGWGVSIILFSALLGETAEPFRPHYHFTPERNWINDPNGLVFFQREYHLFFQYNPFGDKWGHMSWGHAVSPDLLHWQQLPVALPEADGVMIFSGSAVVDWRNSSGFGQNGEPPLVAIYTGNGPTDGRQAQCIAWSNDRGRSWTKFSGNPVLNIDSNNFRDPKVFWYKPTQSWVMVVSMSEQRRIRFYGSIDLKAWSPLSEFGPAAATNGVWECPDFFPLPIEGYSSQSAWVLIVNIGSGSPAGGSGTQYFVGKFDGQTFTLAPSFALEKEPQWVDFGRDCYAAVSWSDISKSDGRRIWMGWMSNWEYAQDVPTTPWRNAMTSPRELSLHRTPNGLRLFQRPVRELEKLRGSRLHFNTGNVEQANRWLRKEHIAGDSLEMILDLEPGTSGQCGVRLFKGEGEGEGEQTVVGFDEVTRRVFLDRSHSGNISFNKSFPGIHLGQAQTIDGRLRLHLLLDACSVEVFVNDGEVILTDLVFPSPLSREVSLFSRASDVMVRSLQVWPLRASFPGR